MASICGKKCVGGGRGGGGERAMERNVKRVAAGNLGALQAPQRSPGRISGSQSRF